MKRWNAIRIICSSACFVGAVPSPSDIPQSPFRLDLVAHSTRTRFQFTFDLSVSATADLSDAYVKISPPPCVTVPSERPYWRGALEQSKGRHLLTTLKFPGDGEYTVWASAFAIDPKGSIWLGKRQSLSLRLRGDRLTRLSDASPDSAPRCVLPVKGGGLVIARLDQPQVLDLSLKGEGHATFAGRRNEAIRIEVSSSEFDPVTFLRDPEGRVIAYNDDASDWNSSTLR